MDQTPGLGCRDGPDTRPGVQRWTRSPGHPHWLLGILAGADFPPPPRAQCWSGVRWPGMEVGSTSGGGPGGGEDACWEHVPGDDRTRGLRDHWQILPSDSYF